MLIISVICLILRQLVKNSTGAQAALAAFCISGVRVSKLRLTYSVPLCMWLCDASLQSLNSVISSHGYFWTTSRQEGVLHRLTSPPAYLSSLNPSKDHIAALSPRWPAIFLPKCFLPWSSWPPPRSQPGRHWLRTLVWTCHIYFKCKQDTA